MGEHLSIGLSPSGQGWPLAPTPPHLQVIPGSLRGRPILCAFAQQLQGSPGQIPSKTAEQSCFSFFLIHSFEQSCFEAYGELVPSTASQVGIEAERTLAPSYLSWNLEVQLNLSARPQPLLGLTIRE